MLVTIPIKAAAASRQRGRRSTSPQLPRCDPCFKRHQQLSLLSIENTLGQLVRLIRHTILLKQFWWMLQAAPADRWGRGGSAAPAAPAAAAADRAPDRAAEKGEEKPGGAWRPSRPRQAEPAGTLSAWYPNIVMPGLPCDWNQSCLASWGTATLH